jgi:hypothetical protein
MSFTQKFTAIHMYLSTQKESSLLDTAAEMAVYALTYFDFLLDYPLPALFVLLAFCQIIPIYLASHQPWAPNRIRCYVIDVVKIYLLATFVYIGVCLPFASFAFAAPNSNINKLIAHTRECAYRFQESKCTSPSVKRSTCPKLERECIALAMCLQQPLYLLRIQSFLEELLAQILSNTSLSAFVVLTGTYVAWGVFRERWIIGQDTLGLDESPILHHVAAPNNTPVVEAAAQFNGAVVGNTGALLVPYHGPNANANGGALGIIENPQQREVGRGNPDIPFNPTNLQDNPQIPDNI